DRGPDGEAPVVQAALADGSVVVGVGLGDGGLVAAVELVDDGLVVGARLVRRGGVLRERRSGNEHKREKHELLHNCTSYGVGWEGVAIGWDARCGRFMRERRGWGTCVPDGSPQLPEAGGGV